MKINQYNNKGQKHGYWVIKRNNENIRWDGYYINNKPIGLSKWYNQDGNIDRLDFYSQ